MSLSFEEEGDPTIDVDGKHTPEPWRYNPVLPFLVQGKRKSGDQWRTIASCQRVIGVDGISYDEMGGNVCRIVACVNACKGLTLDQLERGVVPK